MELQRIIWRTGSFVLHIVTDITMVDIVRPLYLHLPLSNLNHSTLATRLLKMRGCRIGITQREFTSLQDRIGLRRFRFYIKKQGVITYIL